MAGQLAVTARKSIPVENRSSRLFSAAGVGALVIATSQWAHWMGYADWDLLSLIPGFAQVTGLLPNAYADGSNFDCPNKTLGSEIALMSDEMLKTVGKTLCTKEELIAASLRGSDGQPRRHPLAFLSEPAEAVILPLLPIMHAPVQPPRFAQAPAVVPVAQLAKPFTMASIAPVHTDANKDLLDEINLRARRVDSVDPCSGALATRSAAGCGIDQVPVDDPHSGGGSSGPGGSSGGGSDSGHDVTEIDYEDHSGSGGGSSGSDGGEGGEGGGGHDYSDGSHDGGDGHSGDGGEDGHSGDGGSSHDGAGDYTDNSGSHGDGESHGGGDSSHDGGSDSSGHDSVETVDRSRDSGGEDSHSGSSTAEETHGSSGGGDYESRSGGGSDSSRSESSGRRAGDGESSRGGSGGGSDGGGGRGGSGGGHG